MVHADYIVQSSQKISHFLHRHEPPVLGGDITILQNEADVVTVCKPASVPFCDGHGKSPIGKQACTKFQRSCTDGTHSIVLCKPVTGWTHQIRVHLKHIGYPIANDKVYLSENFSPCSSKGTRINRATALACSLPSSDPDSCADVGNKDREADEEFSIDPMCTNCPNLAPVGYDRDGEGLWLHCVQYTGPDWSYECPFPDWAFLDNVSRKK